MRLRFICKIAPKAIPLCLCLTVPVFQKHCKGNIKSDMFQIFTLYLTLINIKERVIDIAALLKAKKIKQAEMAEMLGINQSQISLLRIMQVSMAPFSCKSVDDALRLLYEAKKPLRGCTRRGED